MTRILYDQATKTFISYPRDDEGPVVGLDPRYLDLRLVQEPAPAHDPQTQRLDATQTIDLDALVVTRGWQVIDMPPPPPPPPAPDWAKFQAELQSSNGFPAAWAAIFSGDARPGIGLIASLAVWQATGQWTQFLVAAGACLALLSPQQASHVGLELLSLAHDCNLDPAFCEALEAMLEVG